MVKHTLNNYNESILHSKDLLELLLQGRTINNVSVSIDEEIDLYNKYKDDLLNKAPNLILSEFNEDRSKQWLFPVEYQDIDMLQYLLNKCKTTEEINRVNEEFKLFNERDLIMLLRLFVYIVDYMRKNKFIWGIGRGSAVSSFCLYLIGVHRVNSLKYGLDIKDFLK